jgi:hypothetical protein
MPNVLADAAASNDGADETPWPALPSEGALRFRAACARQLSNEELDRVEAVQRHVLSTTSQWFHTNPSARTADLLILATITIAVPDPGHSSPPACSPANRT